MPCAHGPPACHSLATSALDFLWSSRNGTPCGRPEKGLPAVAPKRDSLRSRQSCRVQGAKDLLRGNRPGNRNVAAGKTLRVAQGDRWFGLSPSRQRRRAQDDTERRCRPETETLPRRRYQGDDAKKTRPWSGSPEKEMSPGFALRNCLVILSAAKYLRSEASGLPGHAGRPCSRMHVAGQVLRALPSG